jgi:hypothetical protein
MWCTIYSRFLSLDSLRKRIMTMATLCSLPEVRQWSGNGDRNRRAHLDRVTTENTAGFPWRRTYRRLPVNTDSKRTETVTDNIAHEKLTSPDSHITCAGLNIHSNVLHQARGLKIIWINNARWPVLTRVVGLRIWVGQDILEVTRQQFVCSSRNPPLLGIHTRLGIN